MECFSSRVFLQNFKLSRCVFVRPPGKEFVFYSRRYFDLRMSCHDRKSTKTRERLIS